jgi:hypothetical protein
MRTIIYSLASIIFIWITSLTSCKKEKEIDTGLGRPPIAHAGKDVNAQVSECDRLVDADLDGTASSDPDNDIVSYSWRRVSGTSNSTLKNATSAKARLADIHTGSYAFELAVYDAGGRKSTDTVLVELDGPGREYNFEINIDDMFYEFKKNYRYVGDDVPQVIL